MAIVIDIVIIYSFPVAGVQDAIPESSSVYFNFETARTEQGW